MADLLYCYNKGCGIKFKAEENKEGACRHHPGVPVFHDALKGWSCCKKRSTDFTEFLNIPGCSFGLHSNVKPPEPEKPAKIECDDAPQPTPRPIVVLTSEVKARPSEDEQMIRLPSTIADSLKTVLEKQMNEMTIKESISTGVDDGTIAKGTSCKNKGCTSVFEGDHSLDETCVYHPGVPVFHEGMKYWSCCQRKTTDFNSFLSQGGCASGQHAFKAKEGDENEKRVACRLDWHQTGSHVTISVFAKVAQPSKTWVEANKVTAKINIVFDGGKSHFEKQLVLRGVIDPEKSNVKLTGTKVEINLKKLEPGSWSSLELVKQSTDQTASDSVNTDGV